MNDASYRDALFSTPLDRVASFSFDEQVVRCFPDMIRRSVPGYGQIIGMLGVIAARHLRHGAHVYDLGCSLGASTLALCQQLPADAFTLDAIDLSPAMVQRARDVLAEHCPGYAIGVHEGDIRTCPLQPAGLIMVNFTLQFLDPADRDAVIERLCRALEPGGVLILAEKITFADDAQRTLMSDWHHDFKRANGYSELEISQKRNALENVMIPDTLDAHHERLTRCGFTRHYTWFQHLNFAAMVAFRN
ncbi:tRNA (cmo5U34)-methyltransferase [Kushneria sinocarnis]|uniref:Carboxy-S-adenosyl-L-methionine synthase n=1 Tax=Kushneria sinocarnis TaxID=595502 RepID=A0A420WTB5_9GAMM|nr:carboxy-S-adenosyl-L-methionine synthase CmoA [Kushneria sinocarnis]RKQ96275.1 tRNA (cmo5U34)-methyltransferase [Kushneria sinocarnis]